MGDRTYIFGDATRALVPTEVETELSNLSNSLSGVTPLSYLLFRTPDGLHLYKAYVDNDGAWVTEQLS